MMLEDLGNLGYQAGALGIVILTSLFLVAVRWWSDILGRVIAGILVSICGVLAISTVRIIVEPDSDTFFWWRLAIFWCFGVGVWIGLIVFVWAQFFARRRGVRSKLTTPTTRKEFDA